MSSLDKLVRLANKFEKFAEEVDSTTVTLTVRPIANAIIDKQAQPLLLKIVAPALQKGGGGDASLGDSFITNAKKVGKGWQVGACIVGSKSTNKDPAVITALDKAATILGSAIASALQLELNRKPNLFVGDTVTGHETRVGNREIGY